MRSGRIPFSGQYVMVGLVGPGKVPFPGIVGLVGMIRAGQGTFWTWARLTKVARKDHLLLVSM